MANRSLELPRLPYSYDALEPYISEEIMKLHHDKHHLAYVNGANAALEKLENARAGKQEIEIRAVLRDLSFNYNGHMLHALFWQSMAPEGKGNNTMGGALGDMIESDFGTFDAFKKQFGDAAKTAEGSGWALLVYDAELDKLLIEQIEKHNIGHLMGLTPVLCLDVWEHAYYLQYQNDRARFIDAWWNVADWGGAAQRLEKAME